MEYIEVVVKLPKDAFELLKTTGVDWLGAEHILNAVANGTPLPKGHGDLKDADKLKHAFIKWSMAVQGSFTDSDIANIVYNSPTIIEADKEQEDGLSRTAF